jgi:hypothetical protein
VKISCGLDSNIWSMKRWALLEWLDDSRVLKHFATGVTFVLRPSVSWRNGLCIVVCSSVLEAEGALRNNKHPYFGVCMCVLFTAFGIICVVH